MTLSLENYLMRIAISTVLDSAKSGVWHVVKNIIEQLKEIDKRNEYLIYTEKNYKDDFGKMPNNFHILRTSISASQPILNILWHSFILPLQLVKDRINVLHLPWHSAALLIKIRPVVLTIHDLTEYRLSTHYSRSRRLYRKIMLPISSRLADRIIAVSEYTKSDIVRFLRVSSSKIDVVSNAPSSRFKPLSVTEYKSVLKNKYGIAEPFILYVGQIQHPNKNLVRLLRAFCKIGSDFGVHHKLVLCGKKHPSADIVYRTVNELHLKKDVIFTGYVPDEDLPYFYNNADLFVYPSLFEGFGIPPLEALSCGTPVIASNTSSLPEVIGNAGILVNPYDVDEIASSMIKVLRDETLQDKMRQKGLKQAEKFSWRKTAIMTLEAYKKVYRSKEA